MKLNISYPASGAQKVIEIDDEKKLRALYDKRMSQEVNGEDLGEQFKGYIFKIGGGNDKQGFPMKQGVLTNTRVRILLGANTTCFRPRREGERRRKSVRGCIIGADISVVHLIVVAKGPEEIEGLTDKYVPRSLGPKRARKFRKLFNLSKEDDVRKYVIRREITPKEGKEPKNGKKKTKAPKIQRLVTPVTLQRRRRTVAVARKRHEKSQAEAAAYAKLVAQRNTEASVKRKASHSKRVERLSGTKPSTTPATKTTTAPVKVSAKNATNAPVKQSVKATQQPASKNPTKTTTDATPKNAPTKSVPTKSAPTKKTEKK